MNGLADIYLAEKITAQRMRETEARAGRARMLAAAGLDHPLRRRLARGLIRAGQRLAPQSAELAPATNQAQPC